MTVAGLKKSLPPKTKPHPAAMLHSAHSGHTPLSAHEKLVKQTQTWVGQAFFGTLLKQMRESPFKSDLFDGGRGGKAFGSLYDQQLAERMSSGAGHSLVNAIVHRLEARAQQVRSAIGAARKAA